MAAKKEPAAEGGGGKKKMLMMVVAGVLVAAGAGAGVAFFMGSKATPPHASEEVPAEAHGEPALPQQGERTYIALEPPFVVNLADPGGDRYLQVEVQVSTRIKGMEETLKKHMPVIRNRLLLLFSQQTAEGLRTREAKEALQKKALEEIRAVLTEATGVPGVDDLYFTSFVTQ